MDRTLVTDTEEHVRTIMQADSSHDWWHIDRVRTMALRLAKEEPDADVLVVELGALLHDIADWKFHDGDLKAGSTASRAWLESRGADPALIDHVCDVVEGVSFKGAGVDGTPKTLEGKIVQDADRLDAIGAIAVARVFAYGGHKGRSMYDPAVEPVLHATFEEYKKNASPSLNHFYEKLFLLKGLLNTRAAKQIAEGRDAFMHAFVEQFLEEWDGRR